jgi:hypothetical protein
MFSALQQHSIVTPDAAERVGLDQVGTDKLAASASANLVALGADLKAYLEQPDKVSIGDFAAVVERLHGEFRMLCGDGNVSPPDADDYAGLFADAQTREFSQSDIGQIESVLQDLLLT